MKTFAWAGLAILLGGCMLPQSPPPVYIGIVTGTARALMEREWTDEPGQVERAYCVQRLTYLMSLNDSVTVRNGRDTLPLASAGEDPYLAVIIDKVVPASVTQATPTRLRGIQCDPGQAIIHTHAPHTCESDTRCEFGGVNAWQCFPSRLDYESLVGEQMPFGVIQCDRRAFIFYWRRHFRAS